MTYPRPNQKRSILKKKFLAALFYIALALLFYINSVSEFLKNATFGIANFLMPERKELLESRMSAVLMAKIKSLEGENKNAQLAPISFGAGYMFSDSVFLKLGSADGIKPGDMVLYEGIALGRLAEVGKNWAKFHLLGKLGDKISLRSGEGKELLFEAVGLGGGEVFTELPRDIALKAGDAVWLGEHADYLAGIVDRVILRETSPSAEVHIILPLKIESLSAVEILSM